MNLIGVKHLPQRANPGEGTRQDWYRLFDAFAHLEEQAAEILEYPYDDPWTAIEAGRKALGGREIISGYASRFRFDVRGGRLFIIKRY